MLQDQSSRLDVVAQLATDIAGTVIDEGHPAFEARRQLWNGSVDRRPLAIVEVTGPEDVSVVIRAAREHGLPLAVRGGGHGLPGFASCDGGLVLDLSQYRGVSIDVEARSARVAGGATWADYDTAAAAHGFASTGGLVSSTGVGGLTLGGGIGWLTRQHGIACDNLLSVELVTATGEQVTASPVSNPELFWALRGGGGNFGVVTTFHFRLHPVNIVHAGALVWPITRAADITSAYREWAGAHGDDFTTMLSMFSASDEPELPDEIRGQPCVGVLGCHTGDAELVATDLAAMRSLQPVVDNFGPLPYTTLQTMFDADFPAGDRYFFTGGFTDGLSDGFLQALTKAIGDRPSPRCGIDVHQMGGAAGRVSETDSAYAGRAARYTYNIIAGWTDPKDDAAHMGWARSVHTTLAPFSIERSYVNFATDPQSGDEVTATYGSVRYARLQEVKRQWDPTNLFRLNQNILP